MTAPTSARPGTAEKVLIMEQRAARRQPLFVPGDCAGPAATPDERRAWLERLAAEQALGMAAMRRAGRTWAEVARAFGVTADAARRAVARLDGADAERRAAKARERALALAGRIVGLHRRGWEVRGIAWAVDAPAGEVVRVLAEHGLLTAG